MAVFKTSDGAIFVQTDGPNTQPAFVGCVDMDTLTEPGGAIDTLIRCFKQDGTGWNVLGSTVTAADPVTTTITTFVEGIQNAFERMRTGSATLFIHQRDGGQAGAFANYARSWILGGVRVGEKTGMDLVHHDTDTQSTMGFGISAFPPVYRAFQRNIGRKATSEAGDLNAVSFCGSGQDFGKYGFIGAANVGAATPDVLYTSDFGVTWTATAADPLAVSEAIGSLKCFPLGRNTTRVIAALGTTRAGGPMAVYYSDDLGVTWTSVTVGSTNAQFAQGPNAMFAYDSYQIWLVAGAGYIYKSSDSGITWTTQDAGVTVAGNIYSVHFITDKIGIVGGVTGKVAITNDGGLTWTLKTAPAAVTLNVVRALDANRFWAGSVGGRIYYTNDGGTTWTERTFAGSGVGTIRSLKFLTSAGLMGIMLADNASPVATIYTTIDGGYTWEAWTTPTNVGLMDVQMIDENNSWAVGKAQASTGVILKVSPKS